MDRFFEVTKCERCGNSLESRTTSWFTEETICMECSYKEDEIKRKLRSEGKSDMEGCGYIPSVA
jgi:recombinational DNA repair protein (RecF pathway)